MQSLERRENRIVIARLDTDPVILDRNQPPLTVFAY